MSSSAGRQHGLHLDLLGPQLGNAEFYNAFCFVDNIRHILRKAVPRSCFGIVVRMGLDEADRKKHRESWNCIFATASLAESSGSELDQKYEQEGLR